MNIRARSNVDLREWWNGALSTLAVAWIGQAGFLLHFGGKRIVIDPYLSDSLAKKYHGSFFPHDRMMPVPIQPQDVSSVDVVLVTHEHTDHMDGATLSVIARVSPHAIFIVPRYSVTEAINRGVPPERIVAVNYDEKTTFPNGLSVTAFPAAHEEYISDIAGNSKFLGYLISCEGVQIFHSGDTVPYAAIEERFSQVGPIDLALFPVNGRDDERRKHGIPGNMTIHEVLHYHQRFFFRSTIVHHFGMFRFNSPQLGELEKAIRYFEENLSMNSDFSVIIPAVGTVYER